MSSTGQAFVKSFARRSQSTATKSRTSTAPLRPDSIDTIAVADPNRSRHGQSGADASATGYPTNGNSGDVGSSVEGLPEREVWVDSFDDTTMRIDQGSSQAIESHLPPGSPRQTHTSYEAMGPMKANEFIARSETKPAPAEFQKPAPQQSPPQGQQSNASESPEAVLADRISRALQQPQARQRNAEAKPVHHAANEATAGPSFASPGVENRRLADLYSDPAPTGYFDPADPAQSIHTDVHVQADPVKSVSTEATPRHAATEILRPSWEVEVFDVPTTVADLFFDEPLFQDLSVRMNEASQDGLRTMLMTSAMAGEGRTTVAIGIALAAASSGIRVALVDGDLASPSLVDELRLDLDHSWVEHVRRGLPMKEIAVHAVEDNLTLIPLLPTDSGRQATAVECAQLIESLKASFDLIIIDGPTADARDMRMLGSAIDSVVIVHDVNQSGQGAADLLAARLQRSGIDGVGIVENFV